MSGARSLGGTHRGVAAFLIQRLTSIYLGAFTIYLIVYVVSHPIGNYAGWSGYFSAGWVRLAWGLFVATLLAHVWVGLRSIYMDYVKPTWLRFIVSTATALALVALVFWAAVIFLRGIA
jgi:succinate dehydrogenase / fumarate reductase membrane anchor subunit